MKGYDAFANAFGVFLVPNNYLKRICNVRFSGLDRRAFYNLSISDEFINSTDTEQLGDLFMWTTKGFFKKFKESETYVKPIDRNIFYKYGFSDEDINLGILLNSSNKIETEIAMAEGKYNNLIGLYDNKP